MFIIRAAYDYALGLNAKLGGVIETGFADRQDAESWVVERWSRSRSNRMMTTRKDTSHDHQRTSH